MSAGNSRRPTVSLLAEAAAALAAGSVTRMLLPFPKLAARLGNHSHAAAATAAEVETIRRAIDAWTRRLPIAPKCFSRGLAAFWMLGRRRRAARLYYGAASFDGKLKAHVWVRSGDQDVVGCDIADRYALLATFPEAQAGDRVSAG